MRMTDFVKLANPPGLRAFFHRNALLFKILLSYIIIGSLLIAVLSTILFRRFSEDSLQGVTSISEKILGQAYRVTDTLWVSTYKYLYQEYNTDNTITNALYTDHVGPFDYREFSKKLSDIVDSNNFIYSVYIYNSKLDVFFSNLAPMAGRDEFFDRDAVERLNTLKSAQSPLLVYRKLTYKNASEPTELNVITLFFFDERTGSAVIYNLDLKILQKMVTPEREDRSNEIFIINNDGLVLSHPELSLVHENMADQKYIRDIMSSGFSNGAFSTQIDGARTIIVYKKWDRLGWVFISMGSYEKLFSKVMELQRSIVLITLIFILVSIIIASFFVGTIYAPLYRLLRRIKSRSRGQELNSLNEYDFLKNTYENLVTNVDRLELFEKNSRQMFKNNVLNKLVQGELARPEDIEKHMRDLNISLRNASLRVVVFRLDDYAYVAQKHSAEDLTLYKYAICNIAAELFSAGYNPETVESSSDHVCVIFNVSPEEIQAADNIKAIARSVQENVRKYLGLSVTAGLGIGSDCLTNAKTSYKSALEATNYRVKYGKAALVDYSEIASLVLKDYEYPIDLERKLTEAIKTGDGQRVINAMEEFIDCISGFSYDGILLALTQVALVSMRTCKSIIDSNETEGLNFKDINRVLAGFDTLEQAKEWFMQYYGDALSVIRRKKENRYDDIVQRIVQYMEQNYPDPDLSVDKLAQLAELSPNYLRVIFKESVGKSISNYLSDVRFKSAQKYLLETDWPANRIAEKIGFQSGGYFYTAFKKLSGFSPDEYRKKFKGQQDSDF